MAIDLPEVGNSGTPEVKRKENNPDLCVAVQGDTKTITEDVIIA
jgi:hypothetical protein